MVSNYEGHIKYRTHTAQLLDDTNNLVYVLRHIVLYCIIFDCDQFVNRNNLRSRLIGVVRSVQHLQNADWLLYYRRYDKECMIILSIDVHCPESIVLQHALLDLRQGAVIRIGGFVGSKLNAIREYKN